MANIDKVSVKNTVYNIVSPAVVSDYVEVIGGACTKPDGYEEDEVILAKQNDVQLLFKATQEIAFGANIVENTNCVRTTLEEVLKNAGGGGGASSADQVSYDNETSQLAADNVQEAIDEVVDNFSSLNQTLTNKTDGIVANINANGSKNLLPVPYYDSGLSVITGTTIACVDNGDGTVTFNGTNSTSGTKAYNYELGTQNLKNLRNKSVTLAVEDMPPVEDAQVFVDIYDDTPTRLVRYTLDASTPNMTITMPATANTYAFQFQVKAERTLTNATPKPMLCLAEDYALNPSWQPPAKTNRELTEDVKGLNSTKASLIGNGLWAHTATITCDSASGAMAYLFTPDGIIELHTAGGTIYATLMTAQKDGYFKEVQNGLTDVLTCWSNAEFTTSRNGIWRLIPMVGNWTFVTS